MESYASMVLGGEHRNVEQLGAFVAWLVNNHLFAQHIEREHGQLITRVRVQELNGADFLSTGLLGELQSSQLTEEGRIFTEQYFVSGRFDRDYAAVDFDGDNEWIRYAALSPAITRAFHAHRQALKPGPVKKLARVLQFPGRNSRGDSASE